MPLYPWNLSTTDCPVPCNTHPLCRGNNCNDDGQCTYKARYASRSVASGIMAKEIFTLSSSTGAFETIDLRMGCGFRQQNFELLFGKNHLHGKPDLVAGILGLGLGEWFGADATIGGASQNVSTTPIVVPEFHTYQYYLYLEEKVGFRRGTFKINSRGEGGTVIDSDAPISVMYRDHFNRVADLVKARFRVLGVEYIGTQGGFDVCFRLRGRFDITKYPSMTFHFQQADYVITDYKANFVMISTEIVCLGLFQMDENRPAFILGTMQQANK
ncbi:aspartic proteinase nepenthesin-1-like [Papaver somniferum]|uniref:aspartic proteinase nepenthesin-1-like n=1 Tax=Papaver somniferum TaxID=3469 RepID=UPI000E7014F5|nr:aspartic proteinase nepenthesin-1-like [Papaver somniferum]